MKAKMSSNPDIPNEVIEMIDEPPSSDVVEPLQKANEEIVSANTRLDCSKHSFIEEFSVEFSPDVE